MTKPADSGGPIVSRYKVLVLIGTRPEAIKMAPVVSMLRASPQLFETRVCLTGQHKRLLQPALNLFGIAPDFNFDILNAGSGLNFIAARVIAGLDALFDEFQADRVLVQGDTTTTFAASLAAFYRRIPVAHIEAGLRSGRLDAPWPEEGNRRMTTVLADLHFAPTPSARDMLRREGVPERQIMVTGNTVVDALHQIVGRIRDDEEFAAEIRGQLGFLDCGRKLVLVTGHRRESFGEGFRCICEAIRRIALRDDVQIVYPVHLNPMVREPVHALLGGYSNIKLIEPVGYEAFVYLMMNAAVILTDSGGVQEEAPSLGKRVLVMREVTERSEAVAAGCAELVGTSPDRIVAATERLLAGARVTLPVGFCDNPFGDGKAGERIVARLAAEAECARSN
jgi:UDP-N-acetylglucosamine 2-epimerase (non-hydrolysing)